MLNNPFPFLSVRGRKLLPIVQGGMGVGVSAHSLAGAVAKENGVGTLASVDLHHHHADLVEEAKKSRDTEHLNRLNLQALDREIQAAKRTAADQGLIAVNVMKAVAEHPRYVQQACASGAGAIVMGAGLPLDLPEMTADYPDVALIPILSDSRGISVVLKKWLRKNRLPDAIVIEHPGHAGGHLGAPKMEDVDNPRFEFRRVLEETLELFKQLALEAEKVPLLVAGGINSHEKVRQVMSWGASGVQVGTAFAVTEEGDAHPNFKTVLAEAKPEDIVTFMSVAGLPARGVLTPWLKNYLRREEKLQSCAKADPDRCASKLNCLSMCGLRDGLNKFGQFCIDTHLAAALRGEVNKGLFFRGADPLPFGSAIRSVRELMNYLLNGVMPEPTQ